MSTSNPFTVTERHGRLCAESGSKWEPAIGYCRAVRSGGQIAVSGTVGVNPDGGYAPTIGEQARRAFAIIEQALAALGARREHVIRTRMYVTKIALWQELAAVHGELFGEIRPATTMIEVSKLIDDEALLEVEADALIPG